VTTTTSRAAGALARSASEAYSYDNQGR
jgi:hypothetical protein